MFTWARNFRKHWSMSFSLKHFFISVTITTNVASEPFSLCYGHTLGKNTIISVLIFGVKSSLTGFQSILMATFVCIWYEFNHFPFPLNPAIYRMGNSANILYVPGWGLHILISWWHKFEDSPWHVIKIDITK